MPVLLGSTAYPPVWGYGTPPFGGAAPPRLGVCMEPIYKFIIYKYTLSIVGDAYAP